MGNRPEHLTYDVCKDLYRNCHFPWLPTGLRFLALRGVLVAPDARLIYNDDEPNLWNDTLVAIDPMKGILAHWPCTAGQPGDYWTRRYPAGGGAPHTRPCCVKVVRGQHKGHKAMRLERRGYWPVIRDVDKDRRAELEAPDRFEYATDAANGINIHACDRDTPTVGPWSSGCHVLRSLWTGIGWQKLYRLVYNKYGDQDYFFYAVAPAEWLGTSTQRLLFGSVDDSVRDLRKMLGLASGIVFDVGVDKTYREHQRTHGSRADGICNNPPWLMVV